MGRTNDHANFRGVSKLQAKGRNKRNQQDRKCETIFVCSEKRLNKRPTGAHSEDNYVNSLRP